MGPLALIQEAWERTALSKRMVLLIVSLLAAGITIAGTLMIGILQGHLVGQVDRQLSDSAIQLSSNLESSDLEIQRGLVPSEYYVLAHFFGGGEGEFLTSTTEVRAGRPILDELLNAAEQVPLKGQTAPITVGSTAHGATWRAVMIPMTLEGSSIPVGVLIVALPLIGVTETLVNTAMSFFLIGVVLVVLTGIAGSYLVQRSLAPLRNIESVAGSIAAGDLSQRVPGAPLTTEVGSLSSSLNRMLFHIERSFEAQHASEQRMLRFVSDASHELRTPLAAIRGYAELYRMGAVEQDGVSDVMARIESESTRMGSLVQDLLTLARLDEGRDLNLTEVNLVEIANETGSDLKALDPTRKVAIQGSRGQKAPTDLIIEADRNQLSQIFLNLAGNITRYTPKSSPVEIRLGRTGAMAEIEFRDHGPGIPSEDRSRVFERFYRTGLSRSRDEGGSGLGLSIVTSIVAAHGGEVSLWETVPHGLTVRVTLPVKQDTMATH